MSNNVFNIVVKRTLILSLFVIGTFAFIFKDPKPIVLGFIFGTIISILGFKLLHNTINRAVEMTPSRASGYSMVHYFLRYIIYFVVLGVAALADYMNFPATILGLVMIKIIIMVSGIFDKEFYR